MSLASYVVSIPVTTRLMPVARLPVFDAGRQSVIDKIFELKLINVELKLWVSAARVCHIRRV